MPCSSMPMTCPTHQSCVSISLESKLVELAWSKTSKLVMRSCQHIPRMDQRGHTWKFSSFLMCLPYDVLDSQPYEEGGQDHCIVHSHLECRVFPVLGLFCWFERLFPYRESQNNNLLHWRWCSQGTWSLQCSWAWSHQWQLWALEGLCLVRTGEAPRSLIPRLIIRLKSLEAFEKWSSIQHPASAADWTLATNAQSSENRTSCRRCCWLFVLVVRGLRSKRDLSKLKRTQTPFSRLQKAWDIMQEKKMLKRTEAGTQYY